MSIHARADRDGFEQRALERVETALDDVDATVFTCAFDLLRVANRLMQDFESAVHRPLGLSWAGFRVLFCIWVENEVEPARLARLCAVSRPTVSSVLKTLERDGMVRRRRSAEDGRVITVMLSSKGRNRVKRAFEHQHRREREWLSALDPTLTRKLVGALRALLREPRPE